jgi:hypothetical protein
MMIGPEREETLSTPDESPDLSDGRRPVPTRLGQKVLSFEFVVLAEYWLAPLFLGVTNYAGVWSDIGAALFLLFVGTLLGFVVLPLRPHLQRALQSLRSRVVFHVAWTGPLVLGLFVTNILQFVGGPYTGPIQLGQTTVYSPFGAWASLTVYVPSAHLYATFNPEGSTILLLLAVLSASSIVLGPLRAARACPTPPARTRTLRSRIASAAILAPLGFISGCPSCSPLYFAALAVIAPSAAEGAQAGIPLVPWIGFAGLLYLVGFWFAVQLLRKATTPATAVAISVPVEAVPT